MSCPTVPLASAPRQVVRHRFENGKCLSAFYKTLFKTTTAEVTDNYLMSLHG